MTTEAILLVGRGAARTRTVLKTHAERLEHRTGTTVRVATYEHEPVCELRDSLTRINAERVYAVPVRLAHTYETLEDLPAALSTLAGSVRYCEPIGRSPALTDLVVERATALQPAAADVSLVLVGFGSSAKPYHRQMAAYHAARLDEGSDYGEVLACYLHQNPTVECVRYTIENDAAVAVPLFLTHTAATTEAIPAKLELDRGGIAYAEPFGDHPRVTDAIHAEVAKQRALADDGRHDAPSGTFETRLTETRRPVATDGEGLAE